MLNDEIMEQYLNGPEWVKQLSFRMCEYYKLWYLTTDCKDRSVRKFLEEMDAIAWRVTKNLINMTSDMKTDEVGKIAIKQLKEEVYKGMKIQMQISEPDEEKALRLWLDLIKQKVKDSEGREVSAHENHQARQKSRTEGNSL